MNSYKKMSGENQLNNSPTTSNGITNDAPTQPSIPPQSNITTPDLDFNYDDDHDDDDDDHHVEPSHPDAEFEPAGYGSTYHTSDPTTPPPEVTRSTVIFCLCAALNSCNLGYDVGMSTVVGKLLQDDMGLSDTQLEMFIGSLNLFAMVGAFFASTVSDRFGRRFSFIVAAVGFVVGVMLMAGAQDYAALMFGRVFVGLGVGFGLAIDPLYIAEISPAAHRGRLVTWSEIAINVGIVLGFSTGLVFNNVDSGVAWRAMFGLGAILPTILILLVVFIMPESPRYLIYKGRLDEGRDILQKIYPPCKIRCIIIFVVRFHLVRISNFLLFPHTRILRYIELCTRLIASFSAYDIDIVVDEIQNSIRREEEMEHASGWSAILFPSPAVRRMLIVGLGAAFSQQIVGIDAIQYFLLFIMEEAGIKKYTTQILILVSLGVLKLICIVYAGRMFDKKGRRPMFMTSITGEIFDTLYFFVSTSPFFLPLRTSHTTTVQHIVPHMPCPAMIIALVIIAITFFVDQNKITATICILGFALYLAAFSSALGPGAWLVPAEVFSLGIRAKAMSIATFLNRTTATIMTSTFLSIAKIISYGGFFILLAVFCVGVLAFYHLYMPETKGKTLEEMSLYFAEITGDQELLEADRRIREDSSRRVASNPVVEEGGVGVSGGVIT